MKDRIEIEKEKIPYSFEIVLGNDLFELEIQYNQRADLFTVTLYKDNEVVVYNEPVVYGVALFQSVFQPEQYPALNIIPLDESKNVEVVTWDNFNDTVFLCIDN